MKDAVIILYCGLALFALGLFFVLRRLFRLYRCDTPVTGTLVGTENYPGANGRVRLVVEFEARYGKLRLREENASSHKFARRVGEPIEIRYNCDNPEEFMVTENHTERKAALICLILGAVFMLAGAMMCDLRYLRWLPMPLMRSLFKLRRLLHTRMF